MKNHSSSNFKKCCQDIKEAIVDLYISVKIRNDKSIQTLTTDKLESERKDLLKTDSLDLIETIKNSIEILLNLKLDEES
jgi:hypothetical protein